MLRRVLRGLGVDVRAGEGVPASLLFLCFFLFITFQYTAKSVRQSTFIDALGAANLPYVYLFVAVCSYPVLRLFARFADRLRRHHLIAATCFTISASMVLFWWLYRLDTAWVPFVFYVWVSIIFVLTVSQFWSLANHTLDPRQAKRLYGFVGAGGLLGGVAGGQVARIATGLVGTEFALLVAAVLVLTVVILIFAVHALSPTDDARVAGAAGLGRLDDARGGLGVILRSRHLQLIAAVLTLTVIVAQVVDLQFNWAVEQTTSTLDQRTAFYGNFFTVMGLLAFMFQLAFTARIHRMLGIGVAMRVLPVTMALGTGALFISVGFFPEALIVAALGLKVGENGIRYSLDQATRELLFLPVPSKARLKAKAFIDVFIQRGAKGIAALLLLPVTFGLLTAVQFGWVTFALIAAWLVVIGAMHREYIRSFRQGLKQRTVDASARVNLADVTTLELLVQSLGSADPRQVLHGIELLTANGRGQLVSPLLLYHDDATVRLKTLDILVETERVDAVPLIERRLADDDPDVRVAAIQALAHFEHCDAVDSMLPRLDDGVPAIRAAAVACVVNQGDDSSKSRALRVLGELLADADPAVRQEAARALGIVREPRLDGPLIRLLYDGNVSVAREAIASVRRRADRDGYSLSYTPTLVSLLGDRRLRHEARAALVALGEETLPALVHVMNDAEEPVWVRRSLPKTIARIGTASAAAALFDALGRPAEPFLRRQLIQASLGLGPSGLAAERKPVIESAVRDEVRGYFDHLAVLHSLGFTKRGRLEGPVVVWNDDDEPSLLERLVAERAERCLQNVFGLLALMHAPDSVWAAHRSLTSGEPALRSHAIEYLDNTLSGEIRRSVMPVIEDAPLLDRLRLAGTPQTRYAASRTETLRTMIAERDGGGDDVEATVTAALYFVYQKKDVDLYADVAALASDAERPFVRDTAAWISGRLNLGRAAG